MEETERRVNFSDDLHGLSAQGENPQTYCRDTEKKKTLPGARC